MIFNSLSSTYPLKDDHRNDDKLGSTSLRHYLPDLDEASTENNKLSFSGLSFLLRCKTSQVPSDLTPQHSVRVSQSSNQPKDTASDNSGNNRIHLSDLQNFLSEIPVSNDSGSTQQERATFEPGQGPYPLSKIGTDPLFCLNLPDGASSSVAVAADILSLTGWRLTPMLRVERVFRSERWSRPCHGISLGFPVYDSDMVFLGMVHQDLRRATFWQAEGWPSV
ncbi:hypothetical protein TKK_0011078 [Trichogramma kaykai]